MRQLLAKATPSPSMRTRAADIKRARDALCGTQRPWERLLVLQLESDARYRERDRLRAVQGWIEPRNSPFCEVVAKLDAELAKVPQGALWKASTGAEIMAYLKHNGFEPPAALTADAIDRMREQVGMNAGGRHGKKTARAVVDAFASALIKRKAPRKTPG